MITLDSDTSTKKWTPPTRPFQSVRAGSDFVGELFACGRLVDRNNQVVPLDVFIPESQGDLLYSLVRYLRPQQTVEVGLANGISALHIALALRDNLTQVDKGQQRDRVHDREEHSGRGHHTAIDPFQSSDWRDVGLVTLRRAGLQDLVSLDPRPSHWALPEIEAAGRRVQFAFIDGSHLFEYVMADFLGIDRILDIGGMIAFDDSDWPAVTSVIRYAVTNRHYRVFDTGVVIEPSPGRPRRLVQSLRRWLRSGRAMHKIFRHDFLFPSLELGIDGRCVVLQKQIDDERDNQRRQWIDF